MALTAKDKAEIAETVAAAMKANALAPKATKPAAPKAPEDVALATFLEHAAPHRRDAENVKTGTIVPHGGGWQYPVEVTMTDGKVTSKLTFYKSGDSKRPDAVRGFGAAKKHAIAMIGKGYKSVSVTKVG